MNKKLAAFAFVFLSHFSLYAIEGTYTGKGFDPYLNKNYSTTVVIAKDVNDVYQATWNEGEGGRKYSFTGTGLKNGSLVSFTFKNAGDAPNQPEGLQIYTIHGDTLEGPFVYLGSNKVGTEKIVKKK